jgi:hypothetical protein
VKHDAFEQISERDVEILGKSLQDFQQATLHADTRLNSLYRYHGTMVPELGSLFGWCLGARECPMVSPAGGPVGQPIGAGSSDWGDSTAPEKRARCHLTAG